MMAIHEDLRYFQLVLKALSSTSLSPVDINVFPSETQKPMQLEHSSHILTTSIYLDNVREIGGKQKLIIKQREAYLHG